MSVGGVRGDHAGAGRARLDPVDERLRLAALRERQASQAFLGGRLEDGEGQGALSAQRLAVGENGRRLRPLGAGAKRQLLRVHAREDEGEAAFLGSPAPAEAKLLVQKPPVLGHPGLDLAQGAASAELREQNGAQHVRQLVAAALAFAGVCDSREGFGDGDHGREVGFGVEMLYCAI